MGDKTNTGLKNSISIDDLTIVTNRQPISHTYENGGITVSPSSGGLVSALNDVAEDSDAHWVAWGDGQADFDSTVIDDENNVRGCFSPYSYSLSRVQLTKEQVDGYYYGYSNQALWPLCHSELEHVNFDDAEWRHYVQTNREFANNIGVLDDKNIWIHDYHFTLLPKYIREQATGQCTLVHFWHIPWPPVEIFEICPQREQILRGLTHNDAIGFHTARYRTNFLDCLDEILTDVTVENDTGKVIIGERSLQTYVSPAGVAPDKVEARLNSGVELPSVFESPAITEGSNLAIGVDRLDYTKGLLERFDAIEYALKQKYLGEDFVYVQIATKSREKICSYKEYRQKVRARVEKINKNFSDEATQPIIYTEEYIPRDNILAALQRADLCLVSSRRDGLNLVAEEYVVASQSNGGALLLSEFTGAHEILDSALEINPFNTTQFAQRIAEASQMNSRRRSEHIRRLREELEEATIQDWLQTHTRLFSEA